MKKILIALYVLASSTAAYAELQTDLSSKYNAAKSDKANAALSQSAISILEKDTDKKATGVVQIVSVGYTEFAAYLETTSGEICKVSMDRDFSAIDCVHINK